MGNLGSLPSARHQTPPLRVMDVRYKLLGRCQCRGTHPGAGERIRLLGSEHALVNPLSAPKQLENHSLFLRPFHHLGVVQPPPPGDPLQPEPKDAR